MPTIVLAHGKYWEDEVESVRLPQQFIVLSETTHVWLYPAEIARSLLKSSVMPIVCLGGYWIRLDLPQNKL